MKGLKVWCGIVVLGLLMLIGRGSVQTLLAQTGAGRLTIQLTNVTDEPIVDYDRVEVPVVPAEGGTYSVPIICYSGPAILLGVEGCGTNSLRVESSTNLVSWAPFPQPGLQLTLSTNEAPAIVPVTGTNRFFRGVE